MNPSDLKELMVKAKQAQAKMADLQRELDRILDVYAKFNPR